LASPLSLVTGAFVAPLTGEPAPTPACSVSFPASPAFVSLPANDGVATLEGAVESSASSITNAASKTAGSGLVAPSPFAFVSLAMTPALLAVFVGRGRRAGDWVPALLEDRDRCGTPPDVSAGLCESRLVRCLACSSAMVRSIAPLSLWRPLSVASHTMPQGLTYLEHGCDSCASSNPAVTRCYFSSVYCCPVRMRSVRLSMRVSNGDAATIRTQ
jgi:hypothetical protein